jgi:hypothetical protein
MSDSDRGPPGIQTEQVPTESPPTMSAMSPAPPPAPAASTARSLATPANGSRLLMLLALLFFVLPWVTVSCADQTLASMSGLDLAQGSVTMHNPMTGETTSPPGGGEADIPVMVGGILVALALLLSFILKGRIGTMASMASLAAAAAAISYTVLYRLPRQAREDAAAQGPPAGGEGATGIDQAQIAEMIRVQTEIGFWLTLAAIVAAIVLAWMVLRREGARTP